MSDQKGAKQVNRRDVLRSGVVAGGGLLATALAGKRVAADDSDDVVGYITRSSYRKLTGADDVDCVPNVEGWGGTFHVERVAEDRDGETGISVEVPDPSAKGGMRRRCRAYTVTADADVELSGGPSGHGPWEQPCGSWVFVGEDDSLETDAVYRVSTVYDTRPVSAYYENVTATDSDGDDIGSPMDLMRVSLERLSPGEQWAQVGKVTRGGLDAGFAAATAIDGERAVVGADGEAAAYVFTLTDHGWVTEAKLGTETAVIGNDVAISGETVLVDAPGEGEQNDSVCVFARSDGDWAKEATLAPDDLAADDGFASAFDVSGDTAVVGAPEAEDTDGDSDGLAYVFTRSDGTWSQTATLEDTRTDVDDEAEGLGDDVAIDGDTVVVGAPYTIYYDYGYASAGGALVFTRSDGDWSQQAFLRSETVNNEDQQGQTVAVENDTAVVASHDAHKGDASGVDAGAAWVYSREGSDWRQQAKLTPDDWETHSWFGYSLSLDGDRMLVGSDVFDGVGNEATGAAYIFARDGSDWRQLTKLTADDGDAYDRFGSDVALAGERAFVCAVDERGGSAANSGSAYLFQR
ncbi:FG-GAP repeat protein [Haloarcula onubensis]|uniref:FG-GAP repeat protein n=1 Tax=Haloarcula onubensis TaxID=2950539 RepID=A0ABU2FRX9_9EURY|nr:FG-GAP repeat protein [Halomicroarcula sp. S3CR25-11]MDS0283530.1 FG-GAP repeat protein [Halomicroarcula sp. S3CR25-11]